MQRVWVFLGACVLSIAPAPGQTTISVPADQPTIQLALDAASNGGEVVVSPGIYFEHVTFPAKQVHLRALGGPKLVRIDGSGSPGPVVRFLTGTTRNSIIEGFTITNGVSTFGGGIVCDNGAGASIIRNHVIGNFASLDGGGICPHPGSDVNVIGNTIAGNTALRRGGGMHGPSTPSVVRDNAFFSNVAARGGAYFATQGSSPPLINNTFVRNRAADGALGITDGAIVLTNCILWSNIRTSFTPVPSNGSLILTFCDVEPLIDRAFRGAGCIETDPEFVDEARGDLHLRRSSPCINAGTNDVVAGGIDPDGQPRILHGTVDMGCDEVAYLLGSGEDFEIHTQVNGLLPTRRTFKRASVNDTVDIHFLSPGGRFVDGIPALAGQIYFDSNPPRSPIGFPYVHLDPTGVFVVLDGHGHGGPFGNVLLPPAGMFYRFSVPPLISGRLMRFQAFVLDQTANNLIFAATDAHEFEVQPATAP